MWQYIQLYIAGRLSSETLLADHADWRDYPFIIKEIRQVDRGFYGAGCQYLGVKNMVEQLNKLLMHYGCSIGVGIKMQLSL